MNIDTLIPVLTALVGAGASFALTGRKVRKESAGLAGEQYASISKMVENYIRDLEELTTKLEEVHRQLIDARIELMRLRAENERLKNGQS